MRKNNLAECPIGSDQCSIPNAQFLSEQREAARVRAVLVEAAAIRQSFLNCALGIELWAAIFSEYLFD
ncbi:MAG: hypothetical protein DMG13_30745 [Acidobacteria bacterium]|nr:MAG: hypothetical protein DMG13_30745 [Acidobacteriota bacterium]